MSPPPPRPVFVVGSFVMACCWFTPRLPDAGEQLHAEGFLMEPGGKGLNVAVGLRRLGASAHLLLGVGNDLSGQALQDLLAREGLSRHHVHTFGGASGHGAGLIGPSGEHVIVVHPGANLQLTASHAQAAAQDIGSSAVVYGQFEVADGVLAEAFRLGRQSGAHNVLNPSPWRPIDGGLLALVDTLLLNEHEAEALWAVPAARFTSDVAWLDAVRPWRTANPNIDVLITLGDAGCLLWPAGAVTPLRVAAVAVDAVDTTGCGDAFAAAWCFGLSLGTQRLSALRLANAAGAWVAARHGVLAALPRLSELRSLELTQA